MSLMPTASIGLGPQELSLAFPFHFAFDGEGRIVQVASVIQRLLPDIRPGAYFRDHFRIERPDVEPTFYAIRERCHGFFLLESRASKALLLRGQMLPLEGRRAMVFLGSPWVTEAAELKNLGLSIRDFALHDPISDFLLLLQAQNASLADAGILANQLEQALANEKELNELQRQFISMVSHEFRTPLTIIEGAAQRMMRRVDRLTPDEIQQRTGNIRKAVKRMTMLIESTLSAARLDAGKFELNARYIDAGELVAENCRLQQEISASHHISVDVGAISGPIYADPYLLNHIFTNLLSNAIKYSPDGCKIEVRGWMEDEQFLVSIRDHGMGISDNDVPRLFERFFRAGTSTGIAGTGIGLHLVKQLVDLHGGSIEVESVEGEGSTFTIRLPIRPAEDVIARGPVGTASPAHITAAE